jgi:hypothetical protein
MSIAEIAATMPATKSFVHSYDDGTYDSDDANYKGIYSADGGRVKFEENARCISHVVRCCAP